MQKPAEESRSPDVSCVFGNSKFNYRVCGIMIRDGSILAMHDERSPYYYLPGGRVKMGETAECAILREIKEELGVTPRIVRPLWLNQGFFTEDVDKLAYHELCVYFLLDISGTDLQDRGETFTLRERQHTHEFEWLAFERLKTEYFYPIFLKTEIARLPENFTLRTEFE
jgi:ADP-ribose pyrophosphatase YjhB (NUDIX family)